MIPAPLWQARPPLHPEGFVALAHAHGSLRGVSGQGQIAWVVPVVTVAFVLLLLALLHFLVTPPSDTPAPGASRAAPETDEEVLQAFADQAADAELDIYTCMGLSSGLDRSGRATRRFGPYVFGILLFQSLLPILLAGFELQRTRYYAEQESWAFRLSGLILYMYSMWRIHDYASDECRTLLLKLGVQHKASWWFLLPPLMGELVNLLTGLLLTVAVFLIFCDSADPTELFLSCLAIKFVGYIDTEVTDAEMRREAMENLRAALELWGATETPSLKRRVFTERMERGARFTTLVCTYGVGTCLALQFFFAHARGLCDLSAPHVWYPFCMGF